MRGAMFVFVLAVTAIAIACDEQDPFADRRNVVERNARADGGDDSGRARELFKALEPQIQDTCGNECHAEGSAGGNPPRFLAGPDAYATIKTFNGLITKSVFESNAAHARRARWPRARRRTRRLAEEARRVARCRGNDRRREGERDHAGRRSRRRRERRRPRRARARHRGIEAGVRRAARSSVPRALAHAGARRGRDGRAGRASDLPSRARGHRDPRSRRQLLEPGRQVPRRAGEGARTGQVFLTESKAGDKLRITFEAIEATTIPVIVDDGPKRCKALQAFIDNAKPQLQNNGCLNCHGDGGNGQSTMDLSQLDDDDAGACMQALRKVNLANKAASLIIDSPAGARGHTGGKVDDRAGYTTALRAWIDSE